MRDPAYRNLAGWLPLPYIVLDVETTGLSPKNDRVIEIAILERAKNGSALKKWTTLINPGRSIPVEVQALTGIADRAVANSPNFGQIAANLRTRLHGKLIVAHNADFDCSFLKAELARVAIDFEANTLCTLQLARSLFPEFRRHNLQSLADSLGLPLAGQHRALADAQVLVSLLDLIDQRFPSTRLQQLVGALISRPV